MTLNELFARFSGLRVAVIGDLMLDTYWWGHVERVSPEAPVPIVALERKEFRIGGAGNVALNATALGAETSVFSVVGEDADADLLMGLLQDSHIDTKHVLRSADRTTTNKIRIIGKNQQMMRLDAEVLHPIIGDEATALIASFEGFVKRYHPEVAIFEDYDKGVLTQEVIDAMIRICREHDVVITADPKRRNFLSYRNVDIFKPNLKEVRDALGDLLPVVDEQTLAEIHVKLKEKLGHKISLVTLSEQGIFYAKGSSKRIIPSHVRNIADVSGAGDTVIAVASAVYAISRDIRLAAEMANLAGGLVCEEVGTAAIRLDRLREEAGKLIPDAS